MQVVFLSSTAVWALEVLLAKCIWDPKTPANTPPEVSMQLCNLAGPRSVLLVCILLLRHYGVQIHAKLTVAALIRGPLLEPFGPFLHRLGLVAMLCVWKVLHLSRPVEDCGDCTQQVEFFVLGSSPFLVFIAFVCIPCFLLIEIESMQNWDFIFYCHQVV